MVTTMWQKLTPLNSYFNAQVIYCFFDSRWLQKEFRADLYALGGRIKVFVLNSY